MRHSIRSDTPDGSHPHYRLPRRLREPVAGESDHQPERALLVGVLLPDTKADLRDPLGELTALAQSAGVEVVDGMIQKRTTLSPGYALGKGKLAELVQRVDAGEVDVVIFDNELSPRQIRGLEQAANCKVIDRSELILDIFASRAETREAQLQVELAQLEYTAPRLRGLWTHLERIAGAGGGTAAGAVGGVGTRGPGERQIEVDRRIVRKRIAHLKREIREIDDRKQREVHSRSDLFTVALVGYTNSGKSTMMNALTDAERVAADCLFATLDTKTARWDLGEGLTVLLSDTVGFVRDLPHGLVASFRATLEETIHADLVMHVVDISSRTAFQQMEAVDDVLVDLGCDTTPQIVVLNKIDIGDDTSIAELLAHRKKECVRVSALTGEGLGQLVQEVTSRMEGKAADLTVAIPQSEGKLLSEIDRLAEVHGRRYSADSVELDISMNRERFRQLLGRYPAMTILNGEIDRIDDLDLDELA
ncbi:MAG: GTPase HflX [Phycisphaerales bacterium]|nr:MAG: GTPase HflX [Phycisphaerales bacterium]